MASGVLWTLGVLFLLQVKHFFFDFVLQTTYQTKHKGIYGHGAGIRHAGAHALATGLILFAVGVGATAGALVAIAEFVFHYHVDWLKERVMRARHWTPADHAYWAAIGLDQALHQASYLVVVALAASIRLA